MARLNILYCMAPIARASGRPMGIEPMCPGCLWGKANGLHCTTQNRIAWRPRPSGCHLPRVVGHCETMARAMDPSQILSLAIDGNTWRCMAAHGPVAVPVVAPFRWGANEGLGVPFPLGQAGQQVAPPPPTTPSSAFVRGHWSWESSA